METCSVRWRSSGGRGEFEFVPAETLADRNIHVLFEPLGITIPAEVYGVRAQGKPRLRKLDSNNRQKLHLPQFVMAVARLPEPAREDLTHAVTFPLENKSFVMDSMEFDVIDDDGIDVTLSPLRVTIRNSTFLIDLQDRLTAIANDVAGIADIAALHPDLAAAIIAHSDAVQAGVNDAAIRRAADEVIRLQQVIFGSTNVGSVTALEKAAELPETEEEEATGKEGRLLTRIHVYKERDRNLVRLAKKDFKAKNGGKLFCVCCGLDPVALYGADGERAIEAHHSTPIEQLQPDSITRASDLDMLCATCHRVVHSQRPCLTVDQVKALLKASAAA